MIQSLLMQIDVVPEKVKYENITYKEVFSFSLSVKNDPQFKPLLYSFICLSAVAVELQLECFAIIQSHHAPVKVTKVLVLIVILQVCF